MVSAISSALQSSQISRGSGSNAAKEAALQKQIADKEAEAKTIKDALKAAQNASETAALKAELADLQAEDKKKASASNKNSSSTAAARQAEFDVEDASASVSSFWV